MKKNKKKTTTENNNDNGGMLKMISTAMAMGSVLMDTPKEANDFRLRMIKAGLPEGAIHLPEDWDSLPEDEKTRRLDIIEKLFNT